MSQRGARGSCGQAVRRGLRGGRGVTLTELMAVIVIVGILAIVGVAVFRSKIFAAKATEAVEMIQNIRAAQESYRATHQRDLNVSGNSITDNNSITGSLGWWPNPSAASPPAHAVPFLVPIGSGQDLSTLAPLEGHWRLLAPDASKYVRFQYASVAGPAPGVANDLPPTLVKDCSGSAWTGTGAPSWPAVAAVTPWYVIQARGDLDGDGVCSIVTGSSFSSEVVISNDGE